jgi:hypothetical protein
MNLERTLLENAIYIGRVDGRQRGIEHAWEEFKLALEDQPTQMQYVLQMLAIWVLIVVRVWR